jgi:tRNA(fMet)-specific endonuclease VapC
VTDNQSERGARQAHLQQAEADFDPLPFDASAARAFGRAAASLRRAGRKSSARVLRDDRGHRRCQRSTVYTCNPAGFRGIDGLEIMTVAVPEPDSGAA